MRRPIVLLPLLACALAGVLIAFGAASAPARQQIICPLAHGLIVPCCGPPIAEPANPLPCCEPVPCRLSLLTIASSPNPVTAGGNVSISGQMSGPSSSGVAVSLWQQLAGGSSFRKVQDTTTDATGAYTFDHPPGRVQTNRPWYVTAGAVQSPTVSESVQAVVTLAASPTKHSATVFGAVSPSHAGQRVSIERLVGTTWVTIAQPLLNRRSRFRLRYPFAPHVQATLRAVLADDSRNVRSVSPELTAVVFPRVKAH